MKTLLLSLAVLVAPALVSAQQNPNRWAASFLSPDHASLTRYEWGFFLVGAAEPIQAGGVVSIGLPGPDPTTQRITAIVDTRPLTVGQYEVRVRGVQVAGAATFFTAWSNPISFERALLPPENLQRVP